MDRGWFNRLYFLSTRKSKRRQTPNFSWSSFFAIQMSLCSPQSRLFCPLVRLSILGYIWPTQKNVAQSKSMIRYYFPRTMTMTTSLEYTIDSLVDNENPIEGETKPRIESPDNLYKVDLKIADSLRPKVNRDPSKVCAGAFGKGPCQGDSRGPLVVELSPRRYVLIGFVSYDSRYGDENATIFTRVSHFLSWTNIFINLTWPQLPKTTERFSEFRPPTV